jgi:hypothetical protein
MKKHIAALLSLIVVVVTISGCIEEEAISGTATGVIIKSFSPDISEIFSEDDVTFSLTVENIGEEDATNVHAKLFGLGTDWSGIDWDDVANRTKWVGYLEKSQPEFKIPGGADDIQWSITSPPGLKVDNTYSAGVRLYYNYSTTALANIKIYNNDYLKSNPEDAESILKSSGIDTFTVTNAPVTIELAGLARPLIHRAGEEQVASFTALISNIGQGKPYMDLENDMTIEITGITIDSDKTCKNDYDTTPKLPRTGKKSVSCQFDLPPVDSYTTIPVEIELSYKYFVDGSTSITVLKSLSI